jgi:outer membrane protein OmpA-like peptidoglycan-associated protein
MQLVDKSKAVGLRRTNNFLGSTRGPLTLAILAFTLAACADIPDAANPVEWYKGAKNVLTGESSDKSAEAGDPTNRLAADRDKPAPGADEATPSLSTVPPRPVAPALFDRDSISSGLVADRENARRYSNEVIRRQGEAGAVIRRAPPPPAPTPAAAPAPKPVPKPAASAPAKPAPAVVSSPVQQQAAAPAPDPIPAPSSTRRVIPATPQARSVVQPQALPKIDIPAVTPNAPQLAAVRPYIAPRGIEDLGTVIISGSGQVSRDVANPRPAVRPRAAPPPLAARQPAFQPRPLGGGSGSYQVATIQFLNGSSKIGAAERRILRQVAAQHKKTGGTIRVVGHASSRTRSTDVAKHKLINLRVSAARADSIAKELVKFGTKTTDIAIGAISDSEPKYYEYMSSGEAGNRRAEIFIDF